MSLVIQQRGAVEIATEVPVGGVKEPHSA
jgi:hypothetical protein